MRKLRNPLALREIIRAYGKKEYHLYRTKGDYPFKLGKLEWFGTDIKEGIKKAKERGVKIVLTMDTPKEIKEKVKEANISYR